MTFSPSRALCELVPCFGFKSVGFPIGFFFVQA